MSSRFIETVKPLQQFLPEGSFLMPEIPALFRVLETYNAPVFVDYDYLMSVSGFAVRLAWQQGWAGYNGLPNQGAFPEGSGRAYIERALDALGIKYSFVDITDSAADTLKNDISGFIDDGKAVLMQNPDVWSAAAGYDEEKLYYVSVFADQSKRIAPYDFNPVTEGSDRTTGYYRLESVDFKAPDRGLLLDTLKTAVMMARVKSQDNGKTVFGIDSFNTLTEMLVWDESFENLEVNEDYNGVIDYPFERPEGYYREDGSRSLSMRFWSGYCDYLCMLNGYSNFYRFLLKYADILGDKAEKLKKAAEYYNKACDYSGELWNYVSPDENGVRKFKTKEVRYAFAAHMQRAKIFTLRAVEILEEILNCG